MRVAISLPLAAFLMMFLILASLPVLSGILVGSVGLVGLVGSVGLVGLVGSVGLVGLVGLESVGSLFLSVLLDGVSVSASFLLLPALAFVFALVLLVSASFSDFPGKFLRFDRPVHSQLSTLLRADTMASCGAETKLLPYMN